MHTSFYRGLTVCDVCPSPDGWEHVPYVSVDPKHPVHGHRFVQLSSGHVLNHVLHLTGLSSHDARWWFMVGTRGCANEDSALDRLRLVSDELTVMG